jgi:hypothetical protein
MLFDLDGNEITHMVYKEDYDRWRGNLADSDYRRIIEEIHHYMDGCDYFKSSHIPGYDWTGTPYEPIYYAVREHWDNARKFFGLLVWEAVQEHEAEWVLRPKDHDADQPTSRKGGVGKTTAALNMARILLERKKYAVLFLDVDITGTNVTDSLDSPFWKNICHAVRYEGKKEHNVANLLSIFERQFMPGLGIPKFQKNIRKKSRIGNTLILQTDKINVIGSQIYDLSNSSSEEVETICKPSILFDELHAFWFVEFLQEICTAFVEVVREENPKRSVAVIIDNSPGYIGIAPAVQDWLTDLGPEKGKYLTVSSLDKQDLLSCGYAIHDLHRLYTRKWDASRKFAEAMHNEKDSGMELRLTPDEERFFLRLVETKPPSSFLKKPTECSVDVTDTGLSFYHGNNKNKGEIYRNKPEKYQGLLINRVPRLVKSGIYAYEAEEVYSFLHRRASHLLSRLLGDDMKNFAAWMVSYDEYIEHQFFEPIIYRDEKWMPPRMRHFEEELMRFIAKRHFSYRDEIFQSILIQGHIVHPKKLDELRLAIRKCHESIIDVIRFIEESGYGHLTRLIHDEWLPNFFLKDFRIAIHRALLETGLPFIEYELWEIEDMSAGPEEMEIIEGIGYEAKNLLKKMDSSIPFELLQQFLPSLSVLVVLATSQPWRSPLGKEFTRLVGSFAVIQAIHWKQSKDRLRNEKRSLQEFLAGEKVTYKELKKFHLESIFHPSLEKSQSLPQLYYYCTSAQARLLDIQQDTDFLIDIIQRLVKEEIHKTPVLPYIRDTIEKVIVNKSMSHDAGRRQIAKGFSSAQYMEEFSSVLEKVLARWEVLD